VESTKRAVPYCKIRKRSEYREVQSIGERFRQPHLMMLYTPSGSSEVSQETKFGITVSRRVGNAVVRNRVKRRLREIIRHRRSTVMGSWRIVVIARPRASTASYQLLEKDFLGFTSWLSRRTS